LESVDGEVTCVVDCQAVVDATGCQATGGWIVLEITTGIGDPGHPKVTKLAINSAHHWRPVQGHAVVDVLKAFSLNCRYRLVARTHFAHCRRLQDDDAVAKITCMSEGRGRGEDAFRWHGGPQDALLVETQFRPCRANHPSCPAAEGRERLSFHGDDAMRQAGGFRQRPQPAKTRATQPLSSTAMALRLQRVY